MRKQLNKPTPREILSAISAIGGSDAYSLSIRQHILETTGKYVDLGSMYTALDRLEDVGFITSWMSEPLPERNGSSRRNFRLQIRGRHALKDPKWNPMP